MTVLSNDASYWSSTKQVPPPEAVRAGELELLLSGYTATVQGQARSIIVEGPCGSGAAELVAQFAERVAADGTGVFRYRCRPSDADLDYVAVAGLAGLPADGPASPHLLSQNSFRFFSGQLDQGPVVIVLEQIHWCDEPSLRWLELLLRRCRDRPLLLVASQRPALVPQWRRLLEAAGPAVGRSVITLAAVEDNDVSRWLDHWWPQHQDIQFTQECRRMSLGLPGILRGLLLTLHEAGCHPGPAALAEVLAVGEQLLADHVETVLRDHPEHVRRVIEALAVLGRPEVETLALLAPVPAALVPETLRLLHQEGLSSATGAISTQVRNAVLDGMSATQRAARQERAARLLNDTGAAAAEIGALLLPLPRIDDPWMKEILRQVADHAERAGNVVEAVRCRARLVENEHHQIDDLIDYTRALVHLDPARAHRLVEEALRGQEDVRVRAALAVQLGKSAIVVGTVPEASEVLAETLISLQEAGRGDERDRSLIVQVESALLILACHQAPAVPGSVRRWQAARSRQQPEEGEWSAADGRYGPGGTRAQTRPGPGAGPEPENAGRSAGRPGAASATLTAVRTPGPTVSDLAGALERALDCGWIMPDAGPGGDQQLLWWVEAAPLLLRSEQEKAVRRTQPAQAGQSGQAGERSSDWYRFAAHLAVRTPSGGSRRAGRAVGILTPSECQVAQLAATGASNREIAATLVIAVRTVEIHLTSVYRKLGITGRAALGRAWPQHLPPEHGQIGA